MKKALLILTALSLFLGACGAVAPTEEPTPVLTGEDIQATAISMAWTMAAQTIEAMPTATFTPVPPTATFTPIFTNTPISTATPLFTATPLPSATSEGDPCNKILSGWEGRESRLLVQNETKHPVTVSLYMYASDRGYCGYLSALVDKKGSTTFTIPIGYYSISVWAQDGSNYNKYLDLGGILNPDKHTVYIRDAMLKYVTP